MLKLTLRIVYSKNNIIRSPPHIHTHLLDPNMASLSIATSLRFAAAQISLQFIGYSSSKGW